MSQTLPADTLAEAFAVAGKVVYDFVIPSRAPWSGVVKKGQTIRIVDLEGNQSGDCVLYNAHDPLERYSASETVVDQKNIYLGKGSRLMSNEGNVMMIVTADNCGRHDTSGGACSCESNTLRYGHHTKHQHACAENFLFELGQHGMGKRDAVEADGSLGIVDGISAPGKYVDLLAEMDTRVVISNCPQINNPCNGFNPTPLRVIITEPMK